jgi:hypothetical protein
MSGFLRDEIWYLIAPNFVSGKARPAKPKEQERMQDL